MKVRCSNILMIITMLMSLMSHSSSTLVSSTTSLLSVQEEESVSSRIITMSDNSPIAEDELIIEVNEKENENDDIEFVIVNVEIADEEIEQSYNANVIALPTFQCYRNGIKVDELIGAVHVSKLHSFITKNKNTRGNNNKSNRRSSNTSSREGKNNPVSTSRFVQQ